MNIFSLTPADFVSAPAQEKDGQGRFVFNSLEKKKKVIETVWVYWYYFVRLFWIF